MTTAVAQVLGPKLHTTKLQMTPMGLPWIARLRKEILALQAKLEALSAAPQSKQAKAAAHDANVKAQVRKCASLPGYSTSTMFFVFLFSRGLLNRSVAVGVLGGLCDREKYRPNYVI